MTRGILIAGNESSLFAAIAAEAARRVERFAAALIPNRISGPVPAPAEIAAAGGAANARIPLSWNPGSPVSARSLALAAENRLEHVDEAILICAPPSVRRRAEDLVPGELETLVNDHIKGWFFLVRELALLFKERNQGALSLVLSDIGAGGGKDEAADLLGPSAAASFRALAQGLLTGSFNAPYQVFAFSSSEIGEDASFASFIFKIMEEDSRRNSGKWHKYGKLGLFGR
jgi:NAD(P)-dependent dehydrogenase (short-subunit alcohol dehydrogenase family)